MKNYSLPEHDLDKVIVKEAIRALNKVTQEKGIRNHICGGLAVSAYLPRVLQRSTIDLDFTLFWGGSCQEFREIMIPFVDYLAEGENTASIKKGEKTYDIFVKGHCDSLLVQHQRRTRKNLEENMSCFEREFANDRHFYKPEINYSVLSPEDLIIHKLSRVIIFIKNFGVAVPQSFRISHLKDLAVHLKEEVAAVGVNADPNEVARLRVYHDIYDIKALSESVGLNWLYFQEAIKDWKNEHLNSDNAERFLDDMGIALK